MKNRPCVFAMARPGALPIPADRRISAFTKPDVFDRWGEDAAATRPSAVESGVNVITMFDTIGYDYWTGGGVTARSVQDRLRAIGDQPVEVQINSPGGDMFEGIAIYNVLREHSKPITVKIMGMAASAASIIAMAGDAIEIGAASFIMIHNCWVLTVGNRHDMTDTAAWLEPFDKAMADVYAARSGQTVEKCASLMDAETYMSGSQAVEMGFADTMLAADQVKQDEAAAKSARDVNVLRGMEMSLMANGRTRAEARAEINKIKGKPDAAPEGKPDAAEPSMADMVASLIQTLKN
jgi:ATP-dependent Clp protease, protease subunit